MNNLSLTKSKTPLQFRVFHTMLGFAVFFTLITVPGQAQVINIFGIPMASEFLWWPFVFFLLQLINKVYGFPYFRHTVYSILLFHAVYVLFLKFATWLPASSFWTRQATYEEVLGKDLLYLVQSSMFLWGCTLLPVWLAMLQKRLQNYILGISLLTFLILNRLWLHPNLTTNTSEIIIPLLLFAFLTIFYQPLLNFISKIENLKPCNGEDVALFRFKVPQSFRLNGKTFKYHHLLFCSSIVFFIASKTMAAKFISIGFLTINVGGIVFSLAYLVADIMTDVYGIERTKQMIWFVIFCNLLSLQAREVEDRGL